MPRRIYIHRETGFGSAYVGSANLSHAALSEGLEWTTKISHDELPYLWGKIAGTFETYWRDDEFQPYLGEARDRLREAICRERASASEVAATVIFDLKPYPFQEEILDLLAAERHGSPSRRSDLSIVKTHRSATLVHPIVRHVFRAATRCLEADMQDRLLYHEGHEEHEGNQSTNRFIPSFSLVTWKFISSPLLIPANFIEVSNGAS